MKAYDSFDHYLPEQWEVNRFWLYNRSLFLIYLTDRNNEFFHGGDGLTCEEVSENSKKSFYPEYLDLIKGHPKLFNKAFVSWLLNMDSEPKYCEVK
jgi:hypothetical protein